MSELNKNSSLTPVSNYEWLKLETQKRGSIPLNYADRLAGFLRVSRQHERQARGEAKTMPGFWLCS